MYMHIHVQMQVAQFGISAEFQKVFGCPIRAIVPMYMHMYMYGTGARTCECTARYRLCSVLKVCT